MPLLQCLSGYCWDIGCFAVGWWCINMDEKIYRRLLNSFEGLVELEKMYSDLDKSLHNTEDMYELHCKPGCCKCCIGAADNKEASVFEMLPMAIKLILEGKAEGYLERLESMDDCASEQCVNLCVTDAEKGLGHCIYYLQRPFVCRLFGDSLYLLHGDKELDFTGCHWLREKYASNPHVNELYERLPLIAETVMQGRSYNELSFTTITDINSALLEALRLVEMKLELIELEEN